MISFTESQIEELRRIAKWAAPNESCAFLLAGRNDHRVARILPMKNVEESPISFTMDPGEVINAYDIAESLEMQVIGIFHSHPAKPTPSTMDTRFMEINPVVWVIFSTSENTLKAFFYDSGVVKEIPLIINTAKD